MQATWFCKSCSYENYASRKKCSRCFKPNIVKQVETKKPKVDKNDPDSVPRNWQQIVDPSSQQPYYYNSVSKNTTWTRPECLMAMSRKVLPPKNQEQLMQEYLKRPARKQVDKDEMGVVEGLHEKNIYFDKFLTFEKDDGTVDPAETRCVISRDAGYTKADKAKQNNKTCFCIHFARGACAHGKECNYYHRIPMTNDMRWIDEFHDVFGRKRHKAKREDMRGVGSFEEECKSLFVTGLKYIPNYDVISVLKIHFGEWGPVERVFPIQKQAAAVVRFRTRYHAEFAKVAMTGQELDKKEVVGIRWAYEDKNVKGLEMKDAANERESEQKEIQKELQRIQQLKRKAELNRQQQQNELQQQENEMQQQQYQQYQQHQQQLQQDSDINKSEVEVEEGIEPPGNDENDSEEEDQGIAPPGSEQAAMISAAEEQRKREVEGVVLISKDAKAKLDANTQLLVDKAQNVLHLHLDLQVLQKGRGQELLQMLLSTELFHPLDPQVLMLLINLNLW
eukprot:TRINITY_DN5579_c0_g1_i1.p1 TRINITY_DN5579_c0_g1~~TRINITY_DN5579_c0_g1_i1.p1  ORF type:complete len:506 (+),score=137.03 TRINITY_DN5579_c0_g1_i1:121-1638(+)